MLPNKGKEEQKANSTKHLKKVVRVANTPKCSEKVLSQKVDLSQNEVNPDSNVFVVTVGSKKDAPCYLRLIKDALSGEKFQRICIEATSADCNAKAIRVANSLVRWGYGAIVKLSMKMNNTLLMVHLEKSATFKQAFESF